MVTRGERSFQVNVVLVLLGLGVAALVVPKLVNLAARRWFSNIEAMDQDRPKDRGDPTWGAGGGHLGQ